MKKTPLLLVAAAIFITGCTTPIQYIKPVTQTDQKLVHMTTNPGIVGVQQFTTDALVEVLFEPTAGNVLFNDMAVFWIYAKNTGTTPFDFGTSFVSVEDKNARPVELLTIANIVGRLSSNKSSQEFASILASSFLAALESAPYAQVHQTGVYSGYTSSGQYVSGTYSTTTPNTTVQYLAQQQNSARIDSFSDKMNNAYQRALANIQRLSLTQVTLAPGSSIEGIVAVPLPNGFTLPNKFRFKLRAGAVVSSHDFTINRSAR